MLPDWAADAALRSELPWKFLAVSLLPRVWVLMLPGWAADAALRSELGRKFLAAPLLPGMWALALLGWAADAALRSVLASLGSLGRYAELVWPPPPAFPP